MNNIAELLEIRNKVKNRKPKYLRQDAHKLKKLKKKWIRPKGIHSKMRRMLRSYRKNPEIGYGSPRKIKNFTKEGLMPVLINSAKDTEDLGKDVSIIVSGSIGLKKRLEIAKKMREKKLIAENLDANKLLDEYEKMINEKKNKIKKTKEEPKKQESIEKKANDAIPGNEKEIKRKVLEKRN